MIRSRIVNHGISEKENINENNIFQLSDEVLLMIFQYLPTKALVNTSRTCYRFQRLCYERKLWYKIECPPDNYESLNLIFDTCVTGKTTHMKIFSKVHGRNLAYRSSICPSHLDLVKRSVLKLQPGYNINNNCLTHLSLINQKIDGRLFTLTLFPKTLKVLNLSGTLISHVYEECSYFKGISTAFENLEELDLSECSWVTSHALLAISKCDVLTRLSLRGCRTIGDCVAYVALASRFGFKALKILDVTDTLVGSSDLISFAGIPNLVEFYFGQYDFFEDLLGHHLITDQTLLALANSNFLKVIDMSGTRATDASINVLLTIPNITNVYAHFTQLTNEGIARLRSGLPNCTIHKCVEYVPGVLP